MTKSCKQELYLYSIAVVLSVLLSVITIIGHPVFDSDGVLYFQVSQTYLEHGFYAAKQLFNWCFYSISLAWLSEIFHLSLLKAAYVLNIVYSALIVVVFARLVRQLDKRFILQVFAVLLILIWHSFAKERFAFTRDQGFWLFGLLSLLVLFDYVKKPRIFKAFLWFFCMAISGLYRVEGMMILLVAPLSLLFLKQAWKKRWVSYVKLNIPTAITVVFLLGVKGHYIFDGIFSRTHDALQESASQHHALLHLPIFVLGYLGELWNAVSFAYILLFIFAFLPGKFSKKMVFQSPISADKIILLLGYAIPCFVITFGFYYSEQFLESRYLLLFLSLFLLVTPFGLLNIFCHSREGGNPAIKKGIFALIALLLLAELIADLYPFGTSHRYVMQTANWLKRNVPAQTMLYTCKGRLAILADRTSESQSNGWRLNDSLHQFCGQAVEFPHLTQYNGQASWAIYGIDVNGDQPQIKAALVKRFGQPMKQFENSHHDAVLLFKTGSPPSRG